MSEKRNRHLAYSCRKCAHVNRRVRAIEHFKRKHATTEYEVKIGYDIIPVSEREELAEVDGAEEVEVRVEGRKEFVQATPPQAALNQGEMPNKNDDREETILLDREEELRKRELEVEKRSQELERRIKEHQQNIEVKKDEEATFEDRVQDEVKRRLGKQEIIETAVKAIGDCILVHTEATHTREALASIRNQAITIQYEYGQNESQNKPNRGSGGQS